MIDNLLDIARKIQKELCTNMAFVHHDFRKSAFPYMVEWSRKYDTITSHFYGIYCLWIIGLFICCNYRFEIQLLFVGEKFVI